jgi:hypothetical protein
VAQSQRPAQISSNSSSQVGKPAIASSPARLGDLGHGLAQPRLTPRDLVGGYRRNDGSETDPSSDAPTLGDLGLGKHDADRARTLAKVTPEQFEAGIKLGQRAIHARPASGKRIRPETG